MLRDHPFKTEIFMILTPTCWQFLQLFDGKFEPFYTFPFRNHQGFNWMVPDTACPREIVPRGDRVI